MNRTLGVTLPVTGSYPVWTFCTDRTPEALTFLAAAALTASLAVVQPPASSRIVPNMAGVVNFMVDSS